MIVIVMGNIEMVGLFLLAGWLAFGWLVWLVFSGGGWSVDHCGLLDVSPSAGGGGLLLSLNVRSSLT